LNLKKILTAGQVILLILIGCSQPPPAQPEPSPAQTAAEAAFDRLNEEVGATEVEKDLAGVSAEATGRIADINTVAEPTVVEMADFTTGEPGWIEVSSTQVFPWSVPRPRAEETILQTLRNEAVSKKVPTSVQVTTLLTDVMGESSGDAYEQTIWSGFFKSTVSGVITNQSEISNRFDELGPDRGYELAMAYRFYVEPVQGQRDPGFYVDVTLENNMLKEGDELVFAVKPSKDCYLNVFNLMADHSVLLMYPNEYMTENFIAAGSTVQIPDPAIRQHIKFVVGTMPGEELTTESAYIVCTKEQVRQVSDLPLIGTSKPVFSGESQSFIKLQRWLTNIPLNQRVEKNLVYHIAKE
jgi:hypothetical protein